MTLYSGCIVNGDGGSGGGGGNGGHDGGNGGVVPSPSFSLPSLAYIHP